MLHTERIFSNVVRSVVGVGYSLNTDYVLTTRITDDRRESSQHQARYRGYPAQTDSVVVELSVRYGQSSTRNTGAATERTGTGQD